MAKSMSFDKNLFSTFRELRSGKAEDSTEKSKESNSEAELFRCSYCQESSLSDEEGVMVCTNCGRESGVIISTDQEWRDNFEPGKDNPSRCGMPVNPLLPQASLGTVIEGFGNGGYCKLQKQNAMPSRERGLLKAQTIITEAGKSLNIPAPMYQNAFFLYFLLTKDMEIKRGNVRKGFMANCQYAICKRNGNDNYVCAERLSEAYGVTLKEYNKGEKLFATYCNHKFLVGENKWKENFSEKEDIMKPTNAEDLVDDACRRLHFSDIQIAEVTYIIRKIIKARLSSSSMPQTIAAGCMILYVKEKNLKVPMSKIADIFMILEATAKSAYNKFSKVKVLLFPKNEEDLISGYVGNCIPKIRLENIYTAPKRSIPKKVEVQVEEKVIRSKRGRPRKTD